MKGQCFLFGDFRFDSQRELLFERASPVSIGRRTMAQLHALLAARGDVVSKADLMDAAWPSLYVEESNLTVQMAALRRRLGRTSTGDEWIATFPRVGYRFAGAFSVEDGDGRAAEAIFGMPMPSLRAPFDLQSYELYVRARGLLLQSPSGNNLARTYLFNVLQRDPLFAAAHACLGVACFGHALYFGIEPEVNRAAGIAHVRTAVSLGPEDPTARWASGFVHLYSGEIDEAQRDWEKALNFAPDHPEVLSKLGDLHVQDGNPKKGVELAERAIRLNPHALVCAYWDLGFAHYAAGQYAEAVDALRRPEMDRLPARRILAAALAQQGNLDEAREEARQFMRHSPNFTVSSWASTQMFRRKLELEHFADGYALAGLPR
jgi:DNA-binding winged helix-turn-helix (wHTH) protein